MVKISRVNAQDNHHLEVFLQNGCILTIDFSSKLNTTRFSLLDDIEYFRTAFTDGVCVRWNGTVEVSLSELFDIAQKETLAPI